MRRTTLPSILVLVAAVAGGCLDESITGVRPVTITVTAPATASVAEVVSATYDATGTGVTSVSIAWGDGDVSEVPFGGVVEAGGFLEHSWAEPGTYEIVGTVTAQNGTATSTVSIVIG